MLSQNEVPEQSRGNMSLVAQVTSSGRLAIQKFSRGPVERVVEAIAVRPQHDLAVLPFHSMSARTWDLHRVIVVNVVGSELEVPFQLAGIPIERRHTIVVQIVPGVAR